MNTEELNRLLEKYYKGESTDEEEERLRRIFTGTNAQDGYEAEREIFNFFNTAIEVPEPSDDFETRIMAGIDQSESNIKWLKFRKYFIPSLSAAAGLLIIAASYFFFNQDNGNRDTFTDPQIAYAETMKILMNVSAQLNEGTKVLEPVSRINEMTIKSFETINKSTKIVGKNLKSLNYLEKAIEISRQPIEKSINK